MINLEKANKYYSASYPTYSEILYDGLHTSLKNKSQTYTVEGVNSDLRHYIPALKCKSKCFFRSINTMKAVFKSLFTLLIILLLPNSFPLIQNCIFAYLCLFNTLVLYFRNLSVDGVNIPVKFLHYEGQGEPYVIYALESNDHPLDADDRLKNYVEYYDFTIYSKSNYKKIEERLKELLER